MSLVSLSRSQDTSKFSRSCVAGVARSEARTQQEKMLLEISKRRIAMVELAKSGSRPDNKLNLTYGASPY